MSPVDDLLDTLIGGNACAKDAVKSGSSDDALLVELREDLDALLERRKEILPMEVYALVVMRAFRTLREA